MVHRLIALIGVGCAGDAEDDDGDVALSPYVMPDRGGCKWTSDFDVEADGTVDWTSAYAFDAEERFVAYTYEDLQGEAYREVEWAYDASGCLIGYSSESVDDEGEYSGVAYTAACDEHANWVEVDYSWETNNGEDYFGNYSYSNVYEDNLLVEREVSATLDDEYLSLWANRFTYLYDDDGRLINERSYDGDEWVQEESLTWLKDDKPLTQHRESADEIRDWSWGYDEHDREVSSVYASEDAEGTYAQRTRHTWDDEYYRFVTSEQDIGADGSPETTWVYTCEGDWPWRCHVTLDGNGEDEPDEDDPHDGEVDHSYRFEYTCDR